MSKAVLWEDQRQGVELPKIDTRLTRKLLLARNKYHYDVLGGTAMVDVYGYEEYFDFLPLVVGTVSKSIEYLKEVLGSLPNKCDSRFRTLSKKIPTLLDQYGVVVRSSNA